MGLDDTVSSALDTHNDPQSFVPEAQARALTLQRDDLQSENARLRRELEAMVRSRRDLDTALANSDGNNRRLAVLREALARKDQEILALKTHQVGRERAVRDSREAFERAEHARVVLEARLRERDGVFSAIETERAALTQALDAARRDGQQASHALRQADDVVNGWRVQLDTALHERDDARRELASLHTAHAALGAAWQRAVSERDAVLARTQAEIDSLRAESADEIEAISERLRAVEARADAELSSARQAAAMSRQSLVDAHEEELCAVRAESTRALESLRTQAEAAARTLGEAHAREKTELVEAHRVELARAREARETAESEALRVREAAESEALRVRETAESEALRVKETAESEALRVREAAESALREAGERHTAVIERLGAELEAAEARVNECESELEVTREKLGSVAVEAAERLQALEGQLSEVRGWRDRYAHKLSATMEQLRKAQGMASETEARFAAEGRKLAEVVGRLTAQLAARGARTAAVLAGRNEAEKSDLDEAISALAEELPEAVGDALWAARDELWSRVQGEA